jgi:amino acid adenylation domain-containing protein
MRERSLLHHLLRDAATCTPDAVAIETDDDAMTYGTLAALSASLAAALLELGLRPGERVGILAPRAAGALIAIYGVLEAGGVYVPLDLDAPDARHARIISDCEVAYLLADSGSLSRALRLAAEQGSIRRVLEIGDDRVGRESGDDAVRWAEIRRTQPRPLDFEVSECDLAYILYTSGSTGIPKGVSLSHRNALSFVEWSVNAFALRAHDRLVNTASLQFDLSVFDIYAAAYVGATLLPVSKEIALFPATFSKWLAERRATVLYAVPSLLTRLADRGSLASCNLSALRTVLFAGEVFPIRPLARLVSALPNATFYNLYGPTETNVITYHRVDAQDVANTRPPPIGRACEHCEVLLVDETGKSVVQPDVEGEVVARGPTVAVKYWNEEARGIRLRHSSDPPTYRTGDFAVWDDAGRLLFRGRRDHMVKSHGYRIELGEVEAALASHPSVLEVAVVAVPDDKLGNRLLAYVQLADGCAATDLKEHCSMMLPAYMCPAAIEALDVMPHGHTGKIDRSALLARHQRVS